MINEIKIKDMCKELDEAASLCCDELGEWWSMLAGIHNRATDCGSEWFISALELEIEGEYQRLKNEFKIIERTETRQVTYRDLVHESESDGG